MVGFRLYVGPDLDRATSIDIGMPPEGAGGIRSFPLVVADGATVHLALTAYDGEGRESGPSNAIVRVPRGPAFDHDGDGASDLLRIDDGSGRIEILPDGGAGASRTLPLTAPAGSAIATRGDFDGDGTADILWQHRATRALTLWLVASDGSVDAVGLPTPDPGLRLLASGDLDADARSDLIFQDATNAEVHPWLVDGATVSPEAPIPGPPPPWRFLGIGDVDADRRSDLVWWNPSLWAVGIWQMNGPMILEEALPLDLLRPAATPLGLGDYDADGTSDLVVRISQRLAFGSLRNGISRLRFIATLPHANIGVGAGRDFDGDGYADLILVDSTARALTVVALGPKARGETATQLDFSAGSLPADLAREIGDADNDWNPDSCDADFDNDGVIGATDFQRFRRCFGMPAVGDCAAVDINGNGDGMVGLHALRLITSGFGQPACSERRTK